jgi:hypothetical protein
LAPNINDSPKWYQVAPIGGNWGTYVSDRAWGTVGEAYSENGDAWKLIKLKRSDLTK